MIFFYFLFGAILGSFCAALTYRWPNGESILKGRSHCPNCNHGIRSYDNIPLLSFLLLRGKCRDCRKAISPRYFYIELGLAFLFTIFYIFSLATPINLFVVFVSYCVLIIDFEHQYIPDTLSFGGIAVVLIVMLISPVSPFVSLASGLSASTFLLLINLFTYGKGMGLGDVKLALFIGMFLGYPMTITWMFLSFVVGSVIGIFLIIFKFKKLKQRIAFGPFLVLSLYLTMIFGKVLTILIFPIL